MLPPVHLLISGGRWSLASGSIQSSTSPPPNQILQSSPTLLNHRWHVGPIDVFINFARDADDSFPREYRLEETHADEMDVEDGRDERVAEHESSKDDASENKYFSIRHYLHGRVVVRWAQ
jgi:hypothetical protein